MENQNIKLKNQLKSAINQICQSNDNGIVSYTFELDLDDLLKVSTTHKIKSDFNFYWHQPFSELILAGLNQTSSFILNDSQDKNQFKNSIKHTLDSIISISKHKNIGPKIIGGSMFSYKSNQLSIWNGIPKSKYVLPECLATKNSDGSWLTISKKISKNANVDNTINSFIKLCDIYKKSFTIDLPKVQKHIFKDVIDSPKKEDYYSIIDSIVKTIKDGALDKVVISRMKHIILEKKLCISSIIRNLIELYPECLNFYFNFTNSILFGSTPERLIKKQQQTIFTEAIAGTAPRGQNVKEDNKYEYELLNSNKDKKEHQFVVKEIIDKINLISNSYDIPNNPSVIKLKNVQHLKTIINANINKKYDLFNLVEILHPTPAIAGTPTDKALNLISLNETNDRGWYSGPIGWMDNNGNGDIFIALRSALQKNNNVYLFSGSGIISESVPSSEWTETEMKLEAILSSLIGNLNE